MKHVSMTVLASALALTSVLLTSNVEARTLTISSASFSGDITCPNSELIGLIEEDHKQVPIAAIQIDPNQSSLTIYHGYAGSSKHITRAIQASAGCSYSVKGK